MKQLTLTKSIWICGMPEDTTTQNSGTALGNGFTELRNMQGFECCLGQWCQQLDGIPSISLLGKEEPRELKSEITLLVDFYNGEFSNTPFSKQAMRINDNGDTTIEEKIRLLTELCANNGYELIVKE